MGASSSLSLTHTEPELSSSSLSTARACPELITAGRAVAGASITRTSDCRARASRYLTSTFCFLRGLITSSLSPSESVSTSLDERAAELTAGPVERRRANRSSDGDAALGALTAPTAATCATLTTSNMSSELGSVSERALRLQLVARARLHAMRHTEQRARQCHASGGPRRRPQLRPLPLARPWLQRSKQRSQQRPTPQQPTH